MADANLDHPLVQKYLKHKEVAERHSANASEHHAKAELARIQMRKHGIKIPIEDHSVESDYVRVKPETMRKIANKPAKKKSTKKKTTKKKKK